MRLSGRIGPQDIIFLTAWIVVPPVLLLLLGGNFFVSSILYLVIPSAYFLSRNSRIAVRAIMVSLLSMPLMIVLDYLAFFNQAWAVPTIFSVRFFQFIPIEDFFFTFWAIFVVIAGRNYFFPHLSRIQVDWKRYIKSVLVILVIFGIFLFLYNSSPESLTIPYYDAWLLVLGFIFPTLFLFLRESKYRYNLIQITIFSLLLMLPYELTANALGFWTFPSDQYLGMLRLLGQSFPIEEFLEWMIFFPAAALAFNKWVAG